MGLAKGPESPGPSAKTAAVFILLALVAASIPASASVYDYFYGSSTSTVQSVPVTLGTGTAGASSVSSLGDSATATVTASLSFFENSTAPVAAVTAPALDGSSSTNTGSATSLAVSFSTSKSPDVIYIIVSIEGTDTVSSVTNSGTALTWAQRAAVSDGTNERVETWYAIDSSTGSQTYTVNVAGGAARFAVIGFGISGANTASPFDPDVAAAATGTGSGTTQSVTLSTWNTNDFLIGAMACDVPNGNAPNPQKGAAFTNIALNHQHTLCFAGEYEKVTATQSSTTIDFTTGGTSVTWAMVGDAVQGTHPPMAHDTQLVAPGAGMSFTVTAGSAAYFWSPAYPASATIYAGSWTLDLWGSSSTSGQGMSYYLVCVDSSDNIVLVVAAGTTSSFTNAKSEVTTAVTVGSTITVPSGDRLLLMLTTPAGSATKTLYWGSGQTTNFETPGRYEYVLQVTPPVSTSYTMLLTTASGLYTLSNLVNFTVWFYTPYSPQIALGSGVTPQTTGAGATLAGGTTATIVVWASNSAFASSTITLSLRYSVGAATVPYAQSTITFTID